MLYSVGVNFIVLPSTVTFFNSSSIINSPLFIVPCFSSKAPNFVYLLINAFTRAINSTGLKGFVT